ncbi:hypothetical protein FNJ88_07745 [Chryseobacterium sp. SNU WT5]|uniref:bacteriocin-like protein n=1 Tax=Chryseobacterium sp. SNU WT5 TaxID=2594269 RepID=UPI0011813E80|nr:hypothetical protein [Chryseobacterium sp. SNU WT5]QDP85460.1 hypothetical protein FNJ88_07745 [Chryseobacterium sp. SNU WT5]
MKNLKMLSRNQLRTVNGGLAQPTGDYKCCWKGTTNCSTTVHHEHGTGGDLGCVKGAVLTPA